MIPRVCVPSRIHIPVPLKTYTPAHSKACITVRHLVVRVPIAHPRGADSLAGLGVFTCVHTYMQHLPASLPACCSAHTCFWPRLAPGREIARLNTCPHKRPYGVSGHAEASAAVCATADGFGLTARRCRSRSPLRETAASATTRRRYRSRRRRRWGAGSRSRAAVTERPTSNRQAGLSALCSYGLCSYGLCSYGLSSFLSHRYYGRGLAQSVDATELSRYVQLCCHLTIVFLYDTVTP